MVVSDVLLMKKWRERQFVKLQRSGESASLYEKSVERVKSV
jgi:hypothetical protein